jgi:hypothetical protein
MRMVGRFKKNEIMGWMDQFHQPKRLDGASVRDLSESLPQGGEVNDRLRINQPHSQASPE